MLHFPAVKFGWIQNTADHLQKTSWQDFELELQEISAPSKSEKYSVRSNQDHKFRRDTVHLQCVGQSDMMKVDKIRGKNNQCNVYAYGVIK